MSKNTNYYQSRINLALDYLNKHLGEEIKMKELAAISHFSLFHFQRIYRALMNESPYETLLRLRLEKAVFLLKHRPLMKISTVAYESGFPTAENFSRQFRARFKVSPKGFKKDKELQNSRIYQEYNPNDFFLRIEESRKEPGKTFSVEIENLESIPIAFIRAIFGADGSGLTERYLELMQWAEKHEIKTTGERTRFGMSIDNPEVTPASKYRYDFALAVTQKHPNEGLVEFGEMPAAAYATVHCQGKLDEVAKAWDYLYKVWLPQSAYLPLHYPAIEEFVQGPEEIGWENFNLKCRLPVELNQVK